MSFLRAGHVSTSDSSAVVDLGPKSSSDGLTIATSSGSAVDPHRELALVLDTDQSVTLPVLTSPWFRVPEDLCLPPLNPSFLRWPSENPDKRWRFLIEDLLASISAFSWMKKSLSSWATR